MQNSVNTPVASSSITEAIQNAMPSAVVQNDTTANPAQAVAAILNVRSAIEGLINERLIWQENAYRTSNEQLYGLLQKCYSLYKELSGSSPEAAAERNALRDYISLKGYKFGSGTHTIVKIVKCVFGADRRRVSAYGIVLRSALNQNVNVLDIPQFIKSSGGVEEIRLAKSPNAMTAKQKATAGASTLTNQTIVNVTAPVFKESLDAGNIGKPVVLLGTWNADGSITVHSFTNSEGAVNAALVAQFSQAKAVAETQKVEATAANDSQIAKTVITQAVAEATALPLAA